jgi:hypothetical protein
MARNLSRFLVSLAVLFTAASAAAQAPPPGLTLQVVGFMEQGAGAQSLGAYLLLGVPLDHWLRGGRAVRAVAEGAASLVPVSAAPAIAPALTPLVARQVVAAAWRTAGLGADDGRLDAMLTRARWSGLLPEVRLRVIRSDRRTDTTSDDPTHASDAWGATQWYEARATFRLDRLLYADEEPQVERLRLDRQEARARVAARVVAELSKWARAQAEEAVAPLDSDARLDALLKVMESELTLDVLTGGWFSAWEAERADR